MNPFMPVTLDAFEHDLALLRVHAPPLSADEKRAAMRPYQDDLPHCREVWNIVGLYHSAILALPVNRLPTLVLWGVQDRVFDVAGAAQLARRFPDSRVARLDGAGHLAMLDAPDEVARRYAGFLAAVSAAAPMKKGQ